MVVTVKVAVVAFAATVTLAATCAAAVLLLDSVTTAPPAGAGLVSATDPDTEVPPITEVGLKVIVLSAADVTVKVPLCVAPYVPEMVSVVLAATELVVTVNVAEVELGATVTLAGM
jgi:hypothetical protein